MTLEPLRLPALPLLEASPGTPQIEGLRVRGTADLQWLIDRPVVERLRFRAEAHLRFQHGPLQTVLGLQDYVDLPPGFNRAHWPGRPSCAATPRWRALARGNSRST